MSRLARSARAWGLFLFAAAGLFQTGVVESASPELGLWIQAGGAGLFVLGSARSSAVAAAPWMGWLALALSVPVCVLIGDRSFVPSACLALAGIGGIAGSRVRFARAIGSPAILLALVGFALVGVQEIMILLATAGHAAPRAASVVGVLLGLAGQDVTVSGDLLHVPMMPRLVSISVTHEKLETATFTGVVLALFLVGTARRVGLRVLALRVALVVAYVPARLAAMLLVYLWSIHMTPYQGPISNLNLLWERGIAFASLLPLGFALRMPDGPGPAAAPVGRPALILASVAACAIALAATFGFFPHGEAKAGRVLVDEYHSRWERTDRPLDVNWYGRASGYNYHSLFAYLDHFYDVERSRAALSDHRLEQTDVLIVKTPTQPFEASEVAAIVRFVERGGGVLLIGDHTNVFGTSTHLNPIARRFGFVFRHDSVLDIEREFVVLDRPDRRVRHPVLGEVDEFFFQTSCSIQGLGFPWGTAAMVGTTLKGQELDYTHGNFFPQVVDAPDMEYGVFNRLWAGEHGAGRVVAFSDSTVFSNFAAFLSDRRELFMGSVAWLNHRQWAVPWRAPVGLAALIGLIVLAFRLLVRGNVWLAALGGATAAVVLPAGLWAGSTWSRSGDLPRARRPLTMISFDLGVSGWLLPERDFANNPKRSIQVFSEWSLRLGYFYETLDCTSREPWGDVLVLGSLDRMPPARVLSRMERFVEDGGRILFLVARTTLSDADRSFAAHWGCGIDPERNSPGGVSDASGSANWQTEAFPAIEGGTPLLVHQDDTDGGTRAIALTRLDRGTGAVYMCALLEEFYDEVMGKSDSTIPDVALRHRFGLVFGLLQGIATGEDGAALAQHGQRDD